MQSQEDPPATPPERRPNARVTWERPGNAVIEVDGVDIADAVTGVHLRLGAGSFPCMMLSLDLFSGEIEGGTQIELQPAVVKALCAMGWTPPSAEPVAVHG